MILQVHVDIESPNGITVTTKLNSSGDVKTIDNNNTRDFSYSFSVQYLPPIVLTCLLPKSYPSHLPPYFTLSVQWLDSTKIANLCLMLDSIWKAQEGQEVMYQWVEWLSSSSLSCLGFDNEITLGHYDTRHLEDRRAVSGSVSPDVDVPYIRSFNDERRHVNFLQNLSECCICFTEYPGVLIILSLFSFLLIIWYIKIFSRSRIGVHTVDRKPSSVTWTQQYEIHIFICLFILLLYLVRH